MLAYNGEITLLMAKRAMSITTDAYLKCHWFWCFTEMQWSMQHSWGAV